MVAVLTASMLLQGSVLAAGTDQALTELSSTDGTMTESDQIENAAAETEEITVPATEKDITWDESLPYAEYSKIHTGAAKLYRSAAEDRKDFCVCVNAGHGTEGGSDVKTLCHPDGSAKVTTGSTAAGATEATAVSSGMTFADGTPESEATLSLALIVRDVLLENGFDVLMIRETEDVQLDNIARTVLANNYADCHIALHYDATDTDKGVFYCSVPDVESYREMEPVASHWQEHEALGQAMIEGMKEQGLKIFGDGTMEMDLTQTSYSTVPSIDLEVGDSVSDHSEKMQSQAAKGVLAGVELFWAERQTAAED